MKHWSGLISSIILSAYISSLLPANGGWAGGGNTDIETPTFPGIDKWSWTDLHHFLLPQLLPQHWKQSCDSRFRISRAYGMHFRSHQHKRLPTIWSGNQTAGRAAQMHWHSGRAATELKAMGPDDQCHGKSGPQAEAQSQPWNPEAQKWKPSILGSVKLSQTISSQETVIADCPIQI